MSPSFSFALLSKTCTRLKFDLVFGFLLCVRFKPATVVVTSELPLGSGLGSSAAFCVALSAALLAFSDSVNLDLNHQGWSMFSHF